MNAMYFRMPVLGPVIKAFAASAGLVGTEQTQQSKRQDQENLVMAVSAGRNIFVFPEGIQTDGRRLLRYSKGAAEIFYDADLLARHPARRTARLQPVVLRVKTIEGEDVIDTPQKWGAYSMARGRSSVLVGMARASMVGSVTIDVLVCPPLDPRRFETAADLVNAAHAATLAIIAPGQTETLTRREWKGRLDAEDFSL
jgi:1-acyl-sn-glycerol-3-phosphate acyltransferase